ncbi:MAG TPA: cytochrome c biogenesis protein ResB [Pyrinomonadaceae bacterium]|jgi:cytochrome c biogenesis protein
MSAIEETKTETQLPEVAKPKTAKAKPNVLARLLNLLSSVRFGVVLLCLLAAACMIGMLVMQQSVEGFDKYYAELTPSQKIVGGALGFFDIYHSWYFNLLLLVLSLNIVLASIDRFPGAWVYIKRRKLDATRAYILHQKQHASFEVRGESRSELAERVSAACRSVGLKPTVTEKGARTFVFGERGAWNRLGAYAVHVALLTTFFGGFLTAQFGRTGQMPLQPGTITSQMWQLNYALDEITRVPVSLPFTVVCTDIQQKLIKKDGSILQNNTIDWLTKIKIRDEQGEHEALVHLNKPYDYRGYRLFQASFIEMGRARTINLRLTPQDGTAQQDVTIQRNGSATLADGTRIDFIEFFPDFTLRGGKPDSASTEYNNPAAQLKITSPAGEMKTAYAFAMELPDGAPVGAPVLGYKYRLADFEKAPDAHILSVQRDPGSNIVYLGFALLCLTLLSVFMFSHQRVWVLIEEKVEGFFEVTLGGNTNRNRLAFEDRFKRLTQAISGHAPVEEEKS